ncbi:MAG: RagB/SusD family nutrient uptake outer membrane protein [Clostridium sp.]|nr:RagB/SusD family nutrient uptake outer membrane protein [Bacteroides sp.]MCM1198541.1 RagB/SusD family nutrient uptake outer membrane protein [Clostridium sp.]
MKKILLPILTVAMGFVSCDMLDMSPRDKLVPETYFRNEDDFKMFSNSFYDNLFEKSPFERQSDIFFQRGSISDELLGGTARQVPTKAGTSGWTWGQLRKINTMLGNMDKCDDPAVVSQYTGLAKFFRARFYYEKVKRFGDVPWYDRELSSTDPDLYKARDSREYVLTKMLEDIDEAIETLPAAVSTFRVNKWAALMLKAQFCLYEGTYRKYHAIELDGHTSDDYLRLAAEAAEQVMNSGVYTLAKDYGTLFREVDADKGEYILAIKMDQTISCTHSATGKAVMVTGGSYGFSKKFIDSFLMKDGSRFTDKEGWETMQFVEEVKDRDPRLGAIIRLPQHVRSNANGTYIGPQIPLTSTGFHFDKFVMAPEYVIAERADMSFNDIPVYRLGEAYLIFAEAKAELGTLTQEDVDASINKLRQRVGMPDMKIAELTVDNYLVSEKYGYRNLASLSPSNLAVLLEVRRERTIELCLEDSSRWDDIVRWKEGKCFEQSLHGMYFPGPGEYDLTGDGVPDICLYATAKAPGSNSSISYIQIQEITIDGKNVPYSDGIVLSDGDHGYMDMFRLKTRSFDENRDYLYPIPTGDRYLNFNLTQNPGWNDGLEDYNPDDEEDEE